MSLEHSPAVEGSGQLADNRGKLADDLLMGAPAIAEFLGTTDAAVYHIRRKGRLPIGKLGKTLIAFRSELRRAAQAVIAS
jgi:hypothetical protein